jgi:four helix bundle protein
METDGFKDFTSLRCWQQSRDVKLFFYRNILSKIPSDEKYNLNFQIRKSARSITANIAEGVGRFYYKEAIQFLRISRGSINELKDDLIFCLDLEIIDVNLYEKGIKLIDQARKSINGFIKYNEKKA